MKRTYRHQSAITRAMPKPVAINAQATALAVERVSPVRRVMPGLATAPALHVIGVPAVAQRLPPDAPGMKAETAEHGLQSTHRRCC